MVWITIRRMIWVFLLSMVPAIEVKLSVPFGVALGLSKVLAYISALCGSSLVVVFLAFFTHWFYEKCREKGYMKRFTGWMGRMAEKHQAKIDRFGPLAIFAYVAVPIPGTGTWTGGIIAGVFNLPRKKFIISIILGNCVSGLILLLVSSGVISLIK